MFCLGSHVDHLKTTPAYVHPTENNLEAEDTWVSRWIKTRYAPFLMKNSTKLCVLLIYLLYLSISIYGCFYIREGLEPARMLVKDSYATKYMNRMADYFWKKGA